MSMPDTTSPHVTRLGAPGGTGESATITAECEYTPWAEYIEQVRADAAADLKCEVKVEAIAATTLLITAATSPATLGEWAVAYYTLPA